MKKLRIAIRSGNAMFGFELDLDPDTSNPYGTMTINDVPVVHDVFERALRLSGHPDAFSTVVESPDPKPWCCNPEHGIGCAETCAGYLSEVRS